jgi:hypothetical protein
MLRTGALFDKTRRTPRSPNRFAIDGAMAGGVAER